MEISNSKSIYFNGDTLNGIFRSFYDQYWEKNEYFERVLTYTDSEHSNEYSSKYAVDFDINTYWHSKDYDPIGHYIVVYLRDYYINIKGFSITSSQMEPGPDVTHQKNWGFDASLDNDTWENAVNFTDANGDMKRKMASAYFGWDYGIYKYFRLTITGEQYDTQKKNSIDLNQIELFGDILSPNEAYKRLNSKCFSLKNRCISISSFLFTTLYSS